LLSTIDSAAFSLSLVLAPRDGDDVDVDTTGSSREDPTAESTRRRDPRLGGGGATRDRARTACARA
jgi:hypothetical protein